MTNQEILNNKVIMDFLLTEALEKTASDIRENTGSGTTVKAVKMMMITKQEVRERVSQYVAVGMDTVREMSVA